MWTWPIKRAFCTVNFLVSDHAWCMRKRSLTRGGHSREVVIMREFTVVERSMLFKYQLTSSCVIISLILMTTLLYETLVQQGEIQYWTILGYKGLINISISFFFLSQGLWLPGLMKKEICCLIFWKKMSKSFMLEFLQKRRTSELLFHKSWYVNLACSWTAIN